MPIKESVSINAPAADIWPYVAEPVLMSVWNKNMVEDDRYSERPVSTGERFAMTFRMSGRDSESSVEVLKCETNQFLELQHTVPWKNKQQIVVERYELKANDSQTVVTQSIDISRAVSWPIRLLFWFISTFGTTQGTNGSSMQQLKQTVEEDCAT